MGTIYTEENGCVMVAAVKSVSFGKWFDRRSQ